MDFDSVYNQNEEEKEIPKDVPKKPAYVSKPGFILTPTLRGHSEIHAIWKIIEHRAAIICGGFVRYMCSPVQTPVGASDMDIYCRNEDAFRKLRKIFQEPPYALQVRHENEMALTYTRPSDPAHPLFICPTVQLIKPVVEGRVVALGTTQEVIENFDFTVIRAGLTSMREALVDADFEHDETNKILRLKNIHCPISSTLRCMKYAKKGYWLPPLQALRLFLDWNNRDEEYREKLVFFLQKTDVGEGLTQEQIDELETLMRID